MALSVSSIVWLWHLPLKELVTRVCDSLLWAFRLSRAQHVHHPFFLSLGLSLACAVANAGYWFGSKVGHRSTNSGAHAALTGSQALSGASVSTSVAVPFFLRNASDVRNFDRLLQSLGKLQPAPTSVLLVSDASPLQPSPSALASLRKVVDVQVALYVLQVNRGPAAARNVALRTARASGSVDLLCFTDADCESASDWVGQMVAAQRRAPGIVSGLTYAAGRPSLVFAYHDWMGTLNGRTSRPYPPGKDASSYVPTADLSPLLYGPTCNLSLALAALDDQLEFDERFRNAAYEDIDFCLRARQAGVTVSVAPGAVVFHNFEASLWGLFRQFFKYGQWEGPMLARHRDFGELFLTSDHISARSLSR